MWKQIKIIQILKKYIYKKQPNKISHDLFELKLKTGCMAFNICMAVNKI